MAVPVASMPDTGDTPFVNSIRAHIPLNKGVGGLPPLPEGYAFLVGDDGAYIVTDDGSYIIVEA